MGLLDDIRARAKDRPPDHGKTLIHGQVKTGKTALAASVAELGKTLYLYVMGDEGINSTYGTPYEDNIVRERVDDVQFLQDVYNELVMETKNPSPDTFKCLVVDGLPALQTMWKRRIAGLATSDRRIIRPLDAKSYDFWTTLGDGFTDMFTFFYSLASSDEENPMHVVMTAQTKPIDDVEGEVKMQPDLHKSPLAAAISRADQIIYTHKVEDPNDIDRQIHAYRVKGSDTVMAGSRAPKSVSAKLPEVFTDPFTVKGKEVEFTLPTFYRMTKQVGGV